MTIKYADVKIREATRRLEALDRQMAALVQSRPGLPYNHPMVKDLRAEMQRLGEQRVAALRELIDLLELDETPVDQMGSG